MRTWIVCFIACLLSLGANAQGFQAGAARRLITPEPLLPVSGGIGTPQPATRKQGDLWVRAVVFEKNGTRVAIVSIDNLGWPSVLGNKARALIQGIQPENILIAATHTHSGPDAYAFPNEKGQSFADMPYLDRCVRAMAEAVNEARANLRPATLRVAVGEAKGQIAYNYYAPDLYDPRCGVIQALATTGPNVGKPIATLVNYAIHPEVIGSGRGILSPDLCGPLYDRIEAKVGGVALFVNGAQGGMVTADNRRPEGKEANTWEECTRIGELLADEALRIIEPAPAQTNPSLSCTTRSVTFPIESDVMKYIVKNSPLKYPVLPGDKVAAQVNLLTVGTAQVLTIPGEALPNIGFYLKRQMRSSAPMLFGLTNDAFGYMLTKVDFRSFRRYDYISRTSLGENTAEIFMDEALKLIANAPAADAYR
ncbi:hypothetical protein F5984_11125 [Rudanella paleaurantiibacter]|uniref:Neutral/alkaline non-lysosomal ceramidase N-terminal domain-containing protein n=1 Tax=Rudanella paleaurantiibacter TaxID=2614655 RepID=A0A7J5U0Z1_9BACT|nr:hypothetical protein [Rudanella paleaurantiibacter]KAB7731339.1 hypothetical protein F5984_11125 [Rudanella paleaurantiibacter]